MTGTLIASTSKELVNALAYQGTMVYTCFPQISDMLRRKFGDEYVLLFARPVENAANGCIDWYSPVQGEPRKIDSMSEEERQRACDRMRAMAGNIVVYAEELVHSPDPLRVTRGHVLKLALSYPDEGYLYAVGQQPVFVCWGFGPGTPGVEPKVLSRLAVPRVVPEPKAAVAGAPAGAVASAPRRSFAWLWWILPLLAALLLLLVLVTSFGSVPALSGLNYFHGPALPFLESRSDPRPQLAELRREVAEMEGKLEQHAAMCKPEKVAPEQALVIPPRAQDTSFLEGEWLCETGLYSQRSGEDVQFAFSFGRDGRGKGVVYEKSDQCEGAARARLADGALHIDLEKQRCRGSDVNYSPISIVCQNGAGRDTECTGINEDGSRWTATFRKVR